MKRSIIKYISLTLTAVLLFTLPIYAQEPQPQQKKDEVVYAKLLADGTVKSAYVVNSFELSEPASFTDYGSYSEVLNLTTTDPLAAKGDAITVKAPKGKFFYQGNLKNVQLPWNIKIGYTLNGEPVSPQELAGKSGAMEITLDITSAEGANQTFNDNYTVQTTVTIDTENCSDIKAPDAAIAAAGRNKVLTFVKLPKDDAHFTIAFQAADFEMDGIQINAVPFSMSFDLPDTSEMTDDIASLKNAITDLNDGTWKLADGGGDLSDGMDEFYSGLFEMHGGMKKLEDGFAELVKANPDLKDGSSQILAALTTIKTELAAFDAADLSSLEQLTSGSSQIKSGLNGLAYGLANIGDNLANAEELTVGNSQVIAYLEQQKGLLNGDDPGQAAQLDGMIAMLEQNSALLSGLDSGVNGDGTAENPGIKAGANALAEQYSEFDGGIQSLGESLGGMLAGMAELKDGIAQLAEKYGEFNSGLKKYLSGTYDIYDGYDELYSAFGDVLDGSEQLNSGMADLYDGMKELADGTEEMHSETSDMDTKMQDKIDEMLGEYTADDFEPVSFVSDKNTGIELVQFVSVTDEIKAPEEKNAPEAQVPEQNFWQRLLALFKI